MALDTISASAAKTKWRSGETAGDARHHDHEADTARSAGCSTQGGWWALPVSTADAFALLERFEAKAKNFREIFPARRLNSPVTGAPTGVAGGWKP